MKTKLFTGMKKNFLTATLLALVLAVGIFPATAFAGMGTPVTEVNISITEPAVGATPDSSPTIETDPAGAADFEGLKWAKVTDSDYDGTGEPQSMTLMQEGAKFEAGNYYVMIANIVCDPDYVFKESEEGLSVTVNDDWVTYADPSPADDVTEINVYKAYYVTNHTHTYSLDKWSSNASSHWHQCTDANCPDKAASIKDTAKHTFKWVVDRKATADQVGLKHEECTVCGYTRNENTKITNSPQTGDTMNIVLPLGIMLVSGAGVGAAVYRKKQHN